ncbi:lipopolysaccharide biosynthesis protein [Alkalibacterium sp. f15]|uniref:lipopolysaccharide biosynthesis protein n=1 Tax=Alkalibacterium sp. f15 TaxID=3414029 RepID=UPI003BF85196
MRTKQAFKSILSSTLLLILTILSGFALPRLMLEYFGSELNGLIASITQFLGYIIIMEAGLGGVIRAALYKPLADGEDETVSAIIKATQDFFKSIGYIFVLYLIFLAIVYPYLVKDEYDFLFTFFLIIIIGSSTFFKFYFGISYQILIEANQQKYVTNFIQMFTVLGSTLIMILLIIFGAPIHIVMLSTMCVYSFRPLLLKWYVKRHYHLDSEVDPDKTALKQRWDGFGHHIAYMLHMNTDIAILTLFTNMRVVSVYAVYYIVIASVRNIINLFSHGVDAAFGNVIANEEKELMIEKFNMYEYGMFAIITVTFTVTNIMILPFIRIYTSGITDVNYIRPEFAILIVLAEVIYSIRKPYNTIIKAAGHYRQTRGIAYTEALINISVSVVLSIQFGLIGVAVGTLTAMLYRTLLYVHYLSKNILYRSLWSFAKKVLVFSASALITTIIVNVLPEISVTNFSSWIIYAIQVTTLSSAVTLVLSVFFYKNELLDILSIFRNIVHVRVH